MSKTGTQVKPTAEVGVDVGAIIVSVGSGFYEIYIDKVMQQPALYNGQEGRFHAVAGVHRVGVYCAGQWVIDTFVEVPAVVKEAPVETAAETVSVKKDVLRGLFGQLMDAAACVEALIEQEGE